MRRYDIWILRGLLLAGTALAQPVLAQPAQVQAMRPSSAENLNNHLARLASNPRDVTALIGAGEAALDMDDARAAAGFFARADTLAPNNGKVKAGLGRVMLKNQNPAEALRLFDQATRLGFPEATLLSDRGLAKDMTGDQAGAQRDYQAALQRTPDDVELTHRYAASLGISGQVDAAERVLKPLLYKSDRAAWRYRAFILAMNNRQADARKIAEQTMPSQLAAAILPYMQKMPYLTAAQKAAAVHFGHFPANVGSTVAAITPTPPAFASATPAAPPASQPAARTPPPARSAQQDRRSRRTETATRLAPAEAPTRNAPAPGQPVPTSTIPQTQTQTPPPPQRAPQAAASAAAPATSNVQGPPAPGFESVPAHSPAPASPPPSQLNAITLAQASAPPPSSPPQGGVDAPSAQPAAPPPTATPAPQQQIDPAVTHSLADIIHAIDVPESERQSSVVAVDLSEVARIQAARRAEREASAAAAAEKAKKAAAAKAKAEADAKARQLAEEKKKAAEEKARLAANPSRNWLQVGTGANKGALAFTMKGLRKKYDSLEPQDAWVASWGRTNRLLVGPFSSFTRARALEDRLKAAGADVFAWKSDAGEVVERLPAK
ncbi:sporulation protein [Sphingobium sp. 22B]|uniref:SPOR domain-containing protein n=1 Tax=unclassified Sphingobium TaxID=2611147 RepID=UPI000785FA47|nr:MULTISPECIES: SPOR domain-containing protein [unclassified Sphingobium]KXU30569.1 sporulation protein [Sphingobium sp. AM]KYC30405.1 sporulation protein [Sphingobium sp. 22B]OAP30127.1 sporulation protein [Sphingobium sp. 20006FA]